METNIEIVLIVVSSIGCGCGLGALWQLVQTGKKIYSALAFLGSQINVLEHRLNIQSKRIEGLESAAPKEKKASSPNLWGYKIDGTPKKKPGRKVVELI